MYSKIEGFAFLPITVLRWHYNVYWAEPGLKRMTGRKRCGVRYCLFHDACPELVGVIVYLLIRTWRRPLTAAEVGWDLQRGEHVEALFYCFLAFSHCIAGIMRGAGKSAVPMFVMLVSWCIIRITYITITVHFIPKIQVIFWAYPLTWSISSIIFLVYFLKADWIHNFERTGRR